MGYDASAFLAAALLILLFLPGPLRRELSKRILSQRQLASAQYRPAARSYSRLWTWVISGALARRAISIPAGNVIQS